MITTTLKNIRFNGPCKEGWGILLKHLGKTSADNEPISILTILESNGFDDALWCLRATDGYDSEIRHLACNFAERVLKFIPKGEDRPRKAIEAARKFADGEISREELAAANHDAARAASCAVLAAACEASRAAYHAVVYDIIRAVSDAAYHAAYAAACDAEHNAERDAEHDAYAAVYATERAEQERIFREWLEKHSQD